MADEIGQRLNGRLFVWYNFIRQYALTEKSLSED